MTNNKEFNKGELPKGEFSGEDLAAELIGGSKADAIIDAWERDREEDLLHRATLAVHTRSSLPLAVTETEKARRNSAEDEALAVSKELYDARTAITQEAMTAALQEGVSELYLFTDKTTGGGFVSLRANKPLDSQSSVERDMKYELTLQKFIDLAVELGVLDKAELDQLQENPNKYYARIAQALHATLIVLSRGGSQDRRGKLLLAGQMFTSTGDVINYNPEDDQRRPLNPPVSLVAWKLWLYDQFWGV